jgi:alpha-tubulin suppressor-like RCC1 family protein
MLDDGGADRGRYLPGAVNELSSQVVMVAGGEYHGMALTADGSVWTWGGNGSGQLGYDTGGASSPDPARVPGLSGVTQIAAGLSVSYGLRSDGTVWAWGDDQDGQLGNAPTGTPAVSPEETFAPGSGIIQIATGGAPFIGYDHTLALRADGTVLAFGDNRRGELGTGGTSPAPGPTPVSGLTGVSQVAVGSFFSLAADRVLGRPGPLG